MSITINPFKWFDKQIYFVKIIMWEACPLRCDYCFVDKENWRVISEEHLMKLIDLLLYSPGHNKLLHLLWWEPLLCFDLIIKAVIYARKLEKKLWKQLDISFCTSWILFNQTKLDIIRDHDIYLAWSIDGSKEIHDRNRKLANWKWSYDLILKNKEIVQKTIKNTHLWIAITVDTNTIKDLYNSYIHLVENEGFECTINVAPVDGKIWPIELQKLFITELEKIHSYIFHKISEWKFYYLNSMNKEFRFNMLSAFRKKTGRCLWFYTEAFTNGDILFNPFVNREEDYNKYVVANIGDTDFIEKVDQYIGCTYWEDQQKCHDCKNDYFSNMKNTLQDVQLNNLLKYRDRVSILYANKIRFEAKNNELYKNYMQLAKDHMYV